MAAVRPSHEYSDIIVPDLFLHPSLPHDEESTNTSEAQKETVNECLPLLNAICDPTQNPFDFNEFGVPELKRDDHIDFCHQNLSEFPAPFVGLDASRPWLVYWGLLSLHLLGQDVTPFSKRYLASSCSRYGHVHPLRWSQCSTKF